MYSKLSKKGLAEIVQVLVMTALSIIAIATVSSYVIKISSLEQLSPAVDCLTMQNSVSRVCIAKDGNLRVLVNSFDDTTKIKLETNNNIFECGVNSETCGTCSLNIGSKEIFLKSLNPPKSGETLTYSFNGCPIEEKLITTCVEQ